MPPVSGEWISDAFSALPFPLSTHRSKHALSAPFCEYCEKPPLEVNGRCNHYHFMTLFHMSSPWLSFGWIVITQHVVTITFVPCRENLEHESPKGTSELSKEGLL